KSRRGGGRVVTQRIPEIRRVAVPVAVEAYLPQPSSREAQRVTRIAAVGEVQDHHDVVAWPAAVPAVEGDHLVPVVDVEDVDVRPAQAAGVVVPVTAEVREVAVKLPDAAEPVVLVPVHMALAERDALQDLLPLADHRDAGGGEDHRGPQRRALPGVPAV